MAGEPHEQRGSDRWHRPERDEARHQRQLECEVGRDPEALAREAASPPAPAAGSGPAAVRHRPPGRARRPAQQQPQVPEGHVGERRRRPRSRSARGGAPLPPPERGVLVPVGVHGTVGAPAAGLFDMPRELLSERYELLRHRGGGAPNHCDLWRRPRRPPGRAASRPPLPRLVTVDAWTSPEAEWLQSTLRLWPSRPTRRAGGETVITRLADILVVQGIRSGIARDPGAQTGRVGAPRPPDPVARSR